MDLNNMVDFFAEDPNVNVLVADEEGIHKIEKRSQDLETMTCRGCQKKFPRIWQGLVIHEPDADICLTCLIDEKIEERGYGITEEDIKAISEMED